MTIFQQVKESVTARQAALQYGLKVKRNGMVCCPFHNDRHPSMKVDKGFYCFSCGAKGDVITFVERFFHISPLEAAKKLAEDFNIPIEKHTANRCKNTRKKKNPERTDYQYEQAFEKWEQYCLRILSDYLHLLEEWKVKFAPTQPEEDCDDRFVEVCQKKEQINYYLEILLDGELSDRIDFLLEKGIEVKHIEERMGKYRRDNEEENERGGSDNGGTEKTSDCYGLV